MRTRLSLLALALVTLCQLPAARADGWYFSEGVGTSEVGGELGQYFDGSANVRVALGRRFGRWAVEGFMMVNMLDSSGAVPSDFYDLANFGVSARYLFPVSPHLDLYLRGGLQHVTLEDTWSENGTYSGRGLHYGAGAQVKGKVPLVGLFFYPLLFSDIGPKVTAALWLETNQQVARLHHPQYSSVDASIKSWTLGIALGSDF